MEDSDPGQTFQKREDQALKTDPVLRRLLRFWYNFIFSFYINCSLLPNIFSIYYPAAIPLHFS